MNTNSFTITRQTINRYSVASNVFLSDGKFLADGCCRLDGNVLRSHELPAVIRIGGLLKLTLGPNSLAAVGALAIGQAVTL